MVLSHVGLVGPQGTALLLGGALHTVVPRGTHVAVGGVGGDEASGPSCTHVPGLKYEGNWF